VYGDVWLLFAGASNESGVVIDDNFGDLSGYFLESSEVRPAVLYGDRPICCFLSACEIAD